MKALAWAGTRPSKEKHMKQWTEGGMGRVGLSVSLCASVLSVA